MTPHPLRRTARRATLMIGASAAALMTGCSAPDDPQGPVPGPREQRSSEAVRDTVAVEHPYVGMWVTADGRIRQQLLPEGRYDEARGDRESAYTGRYEVRGNHIDYWDDTGFTADGTFVSDDELHHGGMIFYRQRW